MRQRLLTKLLRGAVKAHVLSKNVPQGPFMRPLHRRNWRGERKKRAAEALSYNGLVQSWPEITRLARETEAPLQGALL